MAPVASLRPLHFHFVAKQTPPDTSTEAAAVVVANGAAANHAHADSESDADLRKLVVDVPDGWAPSMPEHAKSSDALVAPAHACAARLYGNPAAGYFSVQSFGGELAAVNTYASGLKGAGLVLQPTVHDCHASGIAQLATQVSEIAVSSAGGVVAAGGSAGRDKGSSGHGHEQLDYESPEATGAAVAACLDVIGKGMQRYVVMGTTCSFVMRLITDWSSA